MRRDAGISHFEYEVLALLSEAPDRTLRMSALAMWAGGSLPRLSQVVARMEQRNWVRRTPDPADGRYTLATLTDDGQAKAAAARRHARTAAPLTWAARRPMVLVGQAENRLSAMPAVQHSSRHGRRAEVP